MISQDKIVSALWSNDVTQLDHLVKEGVNLNDALESSGLTPLHWASCFGSLECLQWLLWHKVNVDSKTKENWTPVHLASVHGCHSCLTALLNHGGNFESLDERGNSAAHLAAAHGNSYSLLLLLHAGCDYNQANIDGWTPLHSAAFHGRPSCVQVLKRWDAKTEVVDNNGNTPVHLAAKEGHSSCLRLLVGQPCQSHLLSIQNCQGETAKMLALQFQKEAIVQFICNIEDQKSKAVVHQTSDCVIDDAFPAHAAAYKGDLKLLKELLELGVVSINERDKCEATAAHKAAGNGKTKCLELLMENGANLNLQNNVGETVKDVARRYGHLDCTKLIDMANKTAEDTLDSDISEDEDVYIPQKSKIDAQNLDPQQWEKTRGMIMKKIEEYSQLLEMAERDYEQLGGELESAARKKPERENKAVKEYKRAMADLKCTLDLERRRREKLESKVDTYEQKFVDREAYVNLLEELLKENKVATTIPRKESNKKPEITSKPKKYNRTGGGTFFIKKVKQK